jgi:hypothetical protein
MEHHMELGIASDIHGFPHRAEELAEYAEYIVGLFAVTDIHFHDRVIILTKLSNVALALVVTWSL